MKKSKLITFLVTMVLVFSLFIPFSSMPASATVVQSTYRVAILGYGGVVKQVGSLWSPVYMRDHGYRQTITVETTANTLIPSGGTWVVESAPHGNLRINASGTRNYVNLNRIFQPNQYWLATSYPYETVDKGKDQRVTISNASGNYYGLSTIRLTISATNDSRQWYLMADRSGVSNNSDVIWYTSLAFPRAYWTS